MEIKTKYNIALYPQDQQFITDCIKLAQNNFATQHDEYLLGNNALPHITLCRFESEPSRLSQIWSSISLFAPKAISLLLDQFYISPGQNKHLDHYWIGIAIKPDKLLSDLQVKVYKTLINQDIQSKSNPENYFPHLTLSRCRNDQIPKIINKPVKTFFAHPRLFTVSLGESNPHGVYKKQLFIVQ